MPVRTSIHWIPAELELPDDDILVLIAETDGNVSTGFHDADVWRYSHGAGVDDLVTHWADLPAAPADIPPIPAVREFCRADFAGKFRRRNFTRPQAICPRCLNFGKYWRAWPGPAGWVACACKKPRKSKLPENRGVATRI